MQVPQIELIPLRAAVYSDLASTFDVLIRIVPPAPELDLLRPPLNICLAIDRSSSMRGKKIEYARQAACFPQANSKLGGRPGGCPSSLRFVLQDQAPSAACCPASLAWLGCAAAHHGDTAC